MKLYPARVCLVVSIIFSVLVVAGAAGSVRADPLSDLFELPDGHFTLINDLGETLLETGLMVHVGDRFINEKNRQYEVYRVEERKAYARYTGTVQMYSTRPVPAWRTLLNKGIAGVRRYFRGHLASGSAENVLIGIYHTHTDESYIPGDGASSIEGDGGVIKVGRSLADELEGQGFRVVHDTTGHDPHDANAYARSRRTLSGLLRREPAAVFDVHRDTAPRGAYVAEIGGEEVAKVMFVVGRQNPRMESNLAFAKQLKAAADERYPGLVRGIFFGKGDYNQDLAGRIMLLEIGAHRVPREAAEKGAELLAGIVPRAVDLETGYRTTGRGGSLRALWWMLALVLLGGAAFLFMSVRSREEALARLGQFIPWLAGRGRNK